MERNDIIEILKNEGYPQFMLEKTADKIEELSPLLKMSFENWVKHYIEPSFVIKGYSYATLVEKYKMKPIGAFITLDWIMREPEKATKELNRGIK